MPFQELTVKAHGRAADSSPVRAALYHKENRAPVIELVFDAAILKRAGWDAGASRIVVGEGTGADHGVIQLQLSNAGLKGIALTKRNTKSEDAAMRITCSSFVSHKFKGEQLALHPVVHQIFGSTILVMIETLLATSE